MTVNYSSIAALRVARDVKRRRRADGGPVNTYGGAFGVFSPGEEAEFAPSPVGTAVGHIAKRLVHDLPKEAIENAANYQPGLRRTDYTDIPGPEPIEPLIGNAGEAALNTMGGTAFAAPHGAMGAGPVIRKAVSSEDDVARLLDRERALQPQYAYHSTPVANAESIGRQGIVPQGSGAYFAPNERMMNAWHSEGNAIYRVDRSKVPMQSETGGLSPAQTDSLYTTSKVPPDALEVSFDGGKTWAPAKGATNEPAAPAAATVSGQPAAATGTAEVGPGGGGPAGARSLDEAQAAAARWAGNRQALEGIPGPLKIGEDYFVPGPIGKIHDVAEDYMRGVGRPYTPPTKYHPLDVEHSKAIAQAFEEMKHTPNDKATKAAYDALIDETAAQYQAIKKTGLKVEPIPAGAPDPYAANPRLAAVDVAENNHLWFFPTEGGFGTVNKISDNPLLRKTGEKIGDHELLASDMFRIVHDYFGHLKQGHGFRAAGEDNAWRTHAAMYSDLARPAMTTETRGQNSWVNYGPHGEKNRTASGADTVYADQKIGLLPDWVMYDRGQAPPMMYHGSAADYLKPNLERIGSGQGQMAYGAGYYGSAKEKVAKRYRDMQRDTMLTFRGQQTSLADASGNIQNMLVQNGVDKYKAERLADTVLEMRQLGWSPQRIATAAKAEGVDPEFGMALKAAKNYKFEQSPGHMYKWAIEADPKHFLDWDQRWAKQTPHVQGRVGEDMERSIATQRAALEKKIERLRRGEDDLRYRGRPGAEIMRDRDLFEAQQRLHNLGLENFSGKDIYTRMGLPARSMEEGYVKSSQRLSEKGIPGLQYKNVSGGADSGARNFVIFNPDTVRLLRKYGLIGLPASGLAADLMDGEGFATGGAVADRVARRIKRAKGGKVHVGPITGDTGGRADKVPMRVPNGAYVLTADHVSGLGEGNTEAGMKKLSAMFPKSKPSKLRQLPADEAIPIYAADGEFVVSPEDVIDRFGELDYGHRALDEWQTQERQALIETLQNLAPPAQD